MVCVLATAGLLHILPRLAATMLADFCLHFVELIAAGGDAGSPDPNDLLPLVEAKLPCAASCSLHLLDLVSYCAASFQT